MTCIKAALFRLEYADRNLNPPMKTQFKTFDVRPLLASGEEPFAAIRSRVDGLAAGQGVTILAPFMPAPLIELLKSEGFSSSMERRADGAWAVSFWRE